MTVSSVLGILLSKVCHPDICHLKCHKIENRISVEKWLRCGARLRHPTGTQGSVTNSQTAASTITAQMSQVNEKL